MTRKLQSLSTLATVASLESVTGRFSGRTYFIGKPFHYEVEISNPTSAAVVIPWSADPQWMNNLADHDVVLGSVTLFLRNGIGTDRVLGGALSYGDPQSPASVRSLAPGETVRIRALDYWSGAGPNLKQYLAQTGGRAYIKAVFRLQTGTLLASTHPSAARELTLMVRPQ